MSTVRTRLPKAAYKWALAHLTHEGGSDLFPTPLEVKAIEYNWDVLLDALAKLELSTYEWHECRRFIVPKEEFAFRTATQLDALDSLVLAALIKKYGANIERARLPVEADRVFSYRFSPQPDGSLYDRSVNWHEFWRNSGDRARQAKCEWVAVTDIADFYNQIYHHELENQLDDAGVPAPFVKAILNLLNSITHGVSRGIPVGPHSVHLLAECALIAVDRSLVSKGYEFCRYVDDMHFFCESRDDAEIVLLDVAQILDTHGKLRVQRQKTEIVAAEKFRSRAESMLVDRPINNDENRLLKLIGRHTDDNPYSVVGIGSLSEDEMREISDVDIAELLDLYLDEAEVDYQRIGWLLRRLGQVRSPSAVDYLLENIGRLKPVLGDVARYIMRASPNYLGDLKGAGQRILAALEMPLIGHSDYMQMVLLSLFASVPELDHIDSVMSLYDAASPVLRREIVVAAGLAQQGHWIKERKDEFGEAGPWFRQALISAAPTLPGDEARFWLRQKKRTMSVMEKLVARWAFNSKNMALGEIKL